MKLIDILVQELPKRGGWPEGSISHLDEFIKKEKLTFIVNRDYSFFEDWDGNQVTREQYEAALKQSVWDGTGSPPVGAECEYMKYERDAVGTWWRGTVKYASDCTVVIKTNGCAGETVGHPVNFEFRPISSERDKAIEVLASTICGDIPDTGMATAIMYATRVYDAGYRKQ